MEMNMWPFGITDRDRKTAEGELEILQRHASETEWELLKFLYGNLSTLDDKMRQLLIFDTAMLAASAALLGTAVNHDNRICFYVVPLLVAAVSAVLSAVVGTQWADRIVWDEKRRGRDIEVLQYVLAIRDVRTRRYFFSLC